MLCETCCLTTTEVYWISFVHMMKWMFRYIYIYVQKIDEHLMGIYIYIQTGIANNPDGSGPVGGQEKILETSPKKHPREEAKEVEIACSVVGERVEWKLIQLENNSWAEGLECGTQCGMGWILSTGFILVRAEQFLGVLSWCPLCLALSRWVR